MIDEIVDDYAAYLRVDMKNELAPVEETIDEMLMRMEEFESLINMVRITSDSSMKGTIPEMLSRRDELRVLFKRVDNLEQLVAKVKQNVATVEAQMDRAESELGIMDKTKSFKNMFKPLFFKKPDPARSPGAYTPPELFNTEKFFPPQEDENADTPK